MTTTQTAPTNSDDVIDSRDVIARIKELTEVSWDRTLSDDERVELTDLLDLAEEGEDSSEDWPYGATLIRDSYFTDYARDLAEDIGMVDGTERWPFSCIDWEQAASELRADFTAVEFDGITYWVR